MHSGHLKCLNEGVAQCSFCLSKRNPCSMNASQVILKHVVPSLGFITSNLIFLSSWSAVSEVKRQKQVGCGQTQTLPFASLVINCQAWLLYGYFTKDVYIIAPNIFGCVFGHYYVISTLPLQSIEQQRATLLIMLIGPFILSFTATLAFAVFSDPIVGKNLLGSLCVILLMFFYSSPLASMRTAIRQRSAASINLNLALACLINASLWSAYGFAISDYYYVLGPNLLGVTTSLVQIILVQLYGSDLPPQELRDSPPPSPYEEHSIDLRMI